jgi:hypothetical protein
VKKKVKLKEKRWRRWRCLEKKDRESIEKLAGKTKL